MRLFTLEYYRPIINLGDVNFFKAKKKAQLKIKDQLGPFIFNSREIGKDPLDFIYKRRQKNKMAPYICQPIEMGGKHFRGQGQY